MTDKTYFTDRPKVVENQVVHLFKQRTRPVIHTSFDPDPQDAGSSWIHAQRFENERPIFVCEQDYRGCIDLVTSDLKKVTCIECKKE